MKIGFTGSGQGINGDQAKKVYHLLKELGAKELHHGDCVGGDATAHNIAWRMGLRTIQHPPTNPRARAFTQCTEVRAEKPYLERNHDIVDETEHLIACPRTQTEILRSGTWATIRYARKLGKPVTIIFP
jgi:predicted kinase